jgi:hypothetical protein
MPLQIALTASLLEVGVGVALQWVDQVVHLTSHRDSAVEVGQWQWCWGVRGWVGRGGGT